MKVISSRQSRFLKVIEAKIIQRRDDFFMTKQPSVSLNLSEHQTFRLTPDEKKALKFYAIKNNTTVTNVLRSFIGSINQEDTVKSLKDGYMSNEMQQIMFRSTKQVMLNKIATEKTIIYYLSNIANNLNQLAKWANTYKEKAPAETTVKWLRKTIEFMEPVRKQVFEEVENEHLKNQKVLKGREQDVYNQVFKSQKQHGAH